MVDTGRLLEVGTGRVVIKVNGRHDWKNSEAGTRL